MPARLKLNLFSPLPPVRSDIANFTIHVAIALEAMADVTVWTAQVELPEVTATMAIKQYDPARMDWPLLHQADLNVYNVGNNATFHRAIFDVARQAPGLVILHDTRLQHFFARYAEIPGPDRAFYLESMRRSHGLKGVEAAQALIAGEQKIEALVDPFPMSLAALDGALAAVIHNAADREILAPQTRTPIFYQPLAYTGSGLAQRLPPNGTLRLIVFGFIGFNRRLGSILEALASHADANIRLEIYGALENAAAIEAQTASLGLSNRVRQRGFVPEAELNDALARADLALNLRFPSMGEASGSQLRIWDSGLPSLVTRTGWYATLPDDTVFFVDPEDEVASIQGHLAALRTDPARFRRAGLRGREVLLEQHTPHAYASSLLAIAELAPVLHARRQAVAMSRSTAHTLMAMANVAGIGPCTDSVAEAVWALTQPRPRS